MRLPRYFALLAALLIAACGGSPGTSGTAATGTGGTTAGTGTGTTAGAATFSATQIAPSTSTSTVTSGVTVSGKAEAQIVPNNLGDGSLDFALQSYKPIRGATVELINSATSAVLATATTDGAGNYSFLAPLNTNVKVRVKAEAVSTNVNYAQYNVSIRDNTSADALYVLDSTVFNTGVANVTKNMQAASGWDFGTSSYTGTRASGPFAILDTAYKGMLKIANAQAKVNIPKVTFYWSVDNSSATIGTSYSSGYNDTKATYELFILGKETDDTDEFDETVVAHEFGHYLQTAFSRDDTIAGSHSLSKKLDMRVAFSEGWGNGWGVIATDRTIYTDSSNSGSAGSKYDLGASQGAAKGWYNEHSVAHAMVKINQATGFTDIWNVLNSAAFKTGGPVTSLHNFLGLLPAATQNAVKAALALEFIDVGDRWGTSETHDGGVPGALPVYNTHSNFSGGSANYCLDYTYYNSSGNNTANRLGVSKFIKMTLPTARSYTFTVTGTGSANPAFTIYQHDAINNVIESSYDSSSSVTETKTKSLAAGDAVLVITDSAKSTSNNCFNLTIN